MATPFDLTTVLAPVQRIVRKLSKRRDELLAEAERISEHLKRLSGRRNSDGRGRGRTLAGAARRSGKRIRRSRQQLEAMANEVVEFIRTAGKEGATAKQIKGKFGDLLPSVKAWLKNYSKTKFRTTGAKSKTRYFVE